ncbi:protoporphyrinogen oxidase [Lipingzhangella sp. LS1_29]|uniref:Coproporphyrinogen III oxidase n=1 Tax=Lipingzhangella rawalii TaxID=2055835 RepID=A0ABU2H1J6_9ACTN|nr:protoporphyrinogen oxidase [Lipingzhangella rawalii]MDS1268862.1 protoporphyrinogen oxidase [Lipingzhangella rawalii]
MDQDTSVSTGAAAAPGSRHVVVVGAGISGLTAAYELRCRGLSVTVLEASERVGGKIASTDLGGVRVDTGAESILVRRPEARTLIEELGIGADLTYPEEGLSAQVYSRGALRPLPAGQVMGVPARLLPLARSGIVSPRGVVRAAVERLRWFSAVDRDQSVGDFVAHRMGSEVVSRLVEPLLGGVYAGRAADLSLDATVPQLADGARAGHSAAASARAALRARAAASGPVFASLRGGVGHLVATLENTLRSDPEVRLETGATVRELRRQEGRWTLTVGSAAAAHQVDADGVILACPAIPAARLLADQDPAAAQILSGIPTASMAVVSLAFPRSALPRRHRASGFLVPPAEGRTIKAATFSSRKWPWLAAELDTVAGNDEPLELVRCSVGRLGEEAVLQRPDGELVAAAVDDLRELCGLDAVPVDSHVTRWGGALPQYNVGHLERVREIRARLRKHPALGACGASYDGVGIAACVADARTTAQEVAGRCPTGTTTGANESPSATTGRNT